jgi:hypothetical protein
MVAPYTDVGEIIGPDDLMMDSGIGLARQDVVLL